jgi:hypothetical protein
MDHSNANTWHVCAELKCATWPSQELPCGTLSLVISVKLLLESAGVEPRTFGSGIVLEDVGLPAFLHSVSYHYTYSKLF